MNFGKENFESLLVSTASIEEKNIIKENAKEKKKENQERNKFNYNNIIDNFQQQFYRNNNMKKSTGI